MTMKKLLRVENLSKEQILHQISFDMEPGEMLAVMGPSGSGKSTLLNILGCLDMPTSGEYLLDSISVRTMSKSQRAILRNRKIGFVFQNYNLVPILNVYQNIVLPIELDGNKVDKAYVNKIIQTLHLEGKLDNLPNNLSGGQQQRVAIARALASKPAIMLADEPTGNLDSRTSLEVMQLLRMTSTEFGQTLLMITHNPEIAQIADRMIHIEDGKITK